MPKIRCASSVLSRWRQEFQQNGPGAFEGKRKQQSPPAPGESPEECKKIIGELTVQNELRKKILRAVGQLSTHQKVELARQICASGSPIKKSQLARALGIARSSLYVEPKRPKMDKALAVRIEELHELDDTMGHRKLVVLLATGKNRIKRVMHTSGIAARRKRKKSVSPGNASQVAPNLLRKPEKVEGKEIVFSDILEVRLADGSRVRGCVALHKRTRAILGMAFDSPLRADLITDTIQSMTFEAPGSIWQSDQGKQFGAQQTRERSCGKALYSP